MRPIAGNAALRAFQNRAASVVVARDAHLVGAGVVAQALDVGELRLDLGVAAVDLDDERGAGVGRPAGVGHELGGLDLERVHHLDRARHDAALHDRRHRLARVCGATGRTPPASGPTRAPA